MANTLPDWMRFLAGPGLVLGLYVVKSYALERPRQVVGFALFAAAVALAVPLAWVATGFLFDPYVTSLGLYLGAPISILTVPVGSFLYDWITRAPGDVYEWNARTTAEFWILTPVWFAACMFALVAVNWIYLK